MGDTTQFNYEVNPRKIIYKALIVSTIFAVAYGLNYLCDTILARWLGAESFGDFASAKSTIIFCSMITILGHDFAIFRFLPSYLTNKDWGHTSGYLRYGLATPLLIAIAIITLSIITNTIFIPALQHSPWLIGPFKYISYHPVFHVLWIIPLYGFNTYLFRLLRGLNHIFISMIIIQIGIPLFLIIGMALLKYVYHLDVGIALNIFGRTLLLLLFIQLASALFFLPRKILLTSPIYEKTIWSNTSLHLLLNNLIMLALFSTSIILLEIFGYNEENVGIYAAIFTITNIYFFLPQAITQIFTPPLRLTIETNDPKKIWSFIGLNIGINIVVVIVISVVLHSLHYALLKNFGEVFKNGSTLLKVVTLSYIINIPFYSLWAAMRYSDSLKQMLNFLSLVIIVYLISSIVLIHYYDAMGAAVAMLLSQTLGTILIIRLTIKTFPFRNPPTQIAK